MSTVTKQSIDKFLFQPLLCSWNICYRVNSILKFKDVALLFLFSIGTPVTKVPVVSKQPLDLYRLFRSVLERGGLQEVGSYVFARLFFIWKKLSHSIAKSTRLLHLTMANFVTIAKLTLISKRLSVENKVKLFFFKSRYFLWLFLTGTLHLEPLSEGWCMFRLFSFQDLWSASHDIKSSLFLLNDGFVGKL